MEFEEQFELSFTGNEADSHLINMYDAAYAMIGFHRSLAVTTHFLLHGEVITQAPSLRGAQILTFPAEAGSWKTKAVVTSAMAAGAAGVFALGTAPADTPIGHAVKSAYAYVIQSATGVPLDYDKTIGELIEEGKRQNVIAPSVDSARFDSVIEKCEGAISDMHRPFSGSETAIKAIISTSDLNYEMDIETFDYVRYNFFEEVPTVYSGVISSYNVNTYSGRIYIAELERTIPFYLAEVARSAGQLHLVGASLASAVSRRNEALTVTLLATRVVSRNGRLKKLIVASVT